MIVGLGISPVKKEMLEKIVSSQDQVVIFPPFEPDSPVKEDITSEVTAMLCEGTYITTQRVYNLPFVSLHWQAYRGMVYQQTLCLFTWDKVIASNAEALWARRANFLPYEDCVISLPDYTLRTFFNRNCRFWAELHQLVCCLFHVTALLKPTQQSKVWRYS